MWTLVYWADDYWATDYWGEGASAPAQPAEIFPVYFRPGPLGVRISVVRRQ